MDALQALELYKRLGERVDEVLHDVVLNHVNHLEQENKRLREALEYYAPYEKYEDNITTTYGYTCEIAFDEGETARKALGGE